MHPGVLLIICLLSLYLFTTLVLWNSRSEKKPDVIAITEMITVVPFALQEGQTILGVMDTAKITCFCIGQMEEHVHDEEDTIE